MEGERGDSVTERDIVRYLYYHYSSHLALMPNYTPMSWWECDLLGLTRSGYWREWEVKISVSDFHADAKKVSRYRNRRNKHEQLAAGSTDGPTQFWFVTPKDLIGAGDVPEWAGLLYASVDEDHPIHGRIDEIKPAPRLHHQKASEKMYPRLLTASLYRYWTQRINFDRLKLETLREKWIA